MKANLRIHTLLPMLLLAGFMSQAAFALADPANERKEFRVCQDPGNMPFSNTAGQGIENKLAELFSSKLNLPLRYYSFPQRMNFVRNTLRYQLPGEDFRCDIIMGVPVGFDQVSTTKPYYHSSYVMVFPAGIGLDGLKTGQDLLSLPESVREKLRIGVMDRSPAADWLARHNIIEQGIPYKIMDANPDSYPGQIIDNDLANGKIDVAIVWGPIGSYFAKHNKKALKVVPMLSEPNLKFDYDIAMGIRYGEPQWKQQINDLIVALKPDIDKILKNYDVPITENQAAVVK